MEEKKYLTKEDFQIEITKYDEAKRKEMKRLKVYRKPNDPLKNKANYAKRGRKRHLLKTYGITDERYNEMFIEQDGRCKICLIHQSDINKSLFVDHDHTTGIVRGLLCNNCNTGIGYFKDNIENLTRAIKYLKIINTDK